MSAPLKRILYGASRSLLLRGDEARNYALLLRTTDEYGEALLFCFFFFCGDDPIGGQLFVRRGLGLEKSPGRFVDTKLFLLFASEAGAFALFVGVDAGFFCAARGKGLEASRMH